MIYAYMNEAVNCYVRVENSDRLYVDPQSVMSMFLCNGWTTPVELITF